MINKNTSPIVRMLSSIVCAFLAFVLTYSKLKYYTSESFIEYILSIYKFEDNVLSLLGAYCFMLFIEVFTFGLFVFIYVKINIPRRLTIITDCIMIIITSSVVSMAVVLTFFFVETLIKYYI